jgi:hypothetical protein
MFTRRFDILEANKNKKDVSNPVLRVTVDAILQS